MIDWTEIEAVDLIGKTIKLKPHCWEPRTGEFPEVPMVISRVDCDHLEFGIWAHPIDGHAGHSVPIELDDIDAIL